MCFKHFSFAVLATIMSFGLSQAGSLTLHASRSTPAGAPAGFSVMDLTIDFTDTATPPSIRGQQLVVTLTSGSIYQNQFGSNTAPNSALFGISPQLAFDSFVTLGGWTTTDSQPVLVPSPFDPAIAGSVGGTPKFDTTGADIAWVPGAGVNIPPQNGFKIARITLSNDAQGTISYFGSTADGTTKTFLNLPIGVPEPTSATLLGLAAIGLMGVRRRARRVAGR